MESWSVQIQIQYTASTGRVEQAYLCVLSVFRRGYITGEKIVEEGEFLISYFGFWMVVLFSATNPR